MEAEYPSWLCRLRLSSSKYFELCLLAGVLRFILYAREEARLQTDCKFCLVPDRSTP
jgi:hypothetical protein